jgi:DNA-binding transcriptional LysR family regulator
VCFDGSGMLLDGLNDMGMALSKNNFPVISENYLTHWQLVKQGLGIGIMPEAIGDAEAQVVRVIPAMEPIRFPVWLTTHRELNTSRRVRMVFDLLAQELANGAPISLS